MRLYCSLFLLLFLWTLPLRSQNPLDAWKWFNTCSQSSGGHGYNRVWDICSTPNDDLIVAGTYYKEAHFSGNRGTGHWLEAVGKDHWITNEKFFLAKYRKSGELAWVRTGVGGSNGGSAIKTDSDGNIYCLVTCYESIYLESSNGEEISHFFGTGNASSTLLVKYSPEGKILWHQILDVSGVGKSDLDIGPQDEVLLMVRARHSRKARSLTFPSLSGKDSTFTLGNTDDSPVDYSTFLCQYDAKGELTWVRKFASDSLRLYGHGLAANPKGGFAVGLHFKGHGKYLGLDLDSRIGGTHSLILNFDKAGELVYTTQFGKDVYTQHEGGPPQLAFDPEGRLVVATAVDYSPLRFSPAVGDDLLLKGFNQYTCYLLLLRLDQQGAIDWKYVFKDIDFTGPGSTIYPYWGKPSVKSLDISVKGEIFIAGSALNHLPLSEDIGYKYAPITEGKHWRTHNPFIAAFDSCGKPYWLESLQVSRENDGDYLFICLHQDGDLSFASQILQNTNYTLKGKPILEQNTNQLLFGRRKCPQRSNGPCEAYTVTDTSNFAAQDPVLASIDSSTSEILDSLPETDPPPALPLVVAQPCLSDPILYPNPNRGNFNLQWEVHEAQEFEIRLTNMNGQILHTETKRLPEGTARIQFLGLQLAEGMYIATLSCTSGVESIRFVVTGNGDPGQ